MRVLVLTPNYPEQGNPWSGIFVKKQVDTLRDLGLAVDVFHVAYAHRWPFCTFLPSAPKLELEEADHRGNTYVRFPVKTLPRLMVGPDWLFRLCHRAANARVLRLVEQLRPDVLHFHFGRSFGYAYQAVTRHPELATVITSHGGCNRWSRTNPIYRRIMRRSFSRADRVIAVSEKIRRDAADLGFDVANYDMVGNGIDDSALRTKADYWSPAAGRPLRLSAVGSLLALKGHDDTIRAVADLVARGRDVRLDIVGEGAEQQRLEALIAQLGLGGRVTLHGSLPNDQALAVIGRSDVHCLPSWNEGFGIVYLEALAQSVPTIACRGQGIEPLIVESEAGWLVDPHAPDQIARHLERLMAEPELLGQAGERGRQYVQDRWTWKEVCRQIVAVYEKAMAAAASRRT